jgi:hypothetical protein
VSTAQALALIFVAAYMDRPDHNRPTAPTASQKRILAGGDGTPSPGSGPRTPPQAVAPRSTRNGSNTHQASTQGEAQKNSRVTTLPLLGVEAPTTLIVPSI